VDSDCGLIAFEFGDERTLALRQRFADAALDEDEAGLSGTVKK
jgi:hypothetical protein